MSETSDEHNKRDGLGQLGRTVLRGPLGRILLGCTPSYIGAFGEQTSVTARLRNLRASLRRLRNLHPQDPHRIRNLPPHAEKGVRASRELGHDRLDTRVGPFGVEVEKGLERLRLTCAKNEWGLDFDLVFDGFVPALEEPAKILRLGNRLVEHTMRFAQVGNYSGEINVGGHHYDVTPDTWMGARDHSWGVRPNTGESEPEGIIEAKYRPQGAFGHFHNWIPIQFPDFMIKVYFDEDKDGFLSFTL